MFNSNNSSAAFCATDVQRLCGKRNRRLLGYFTDHVHHGQCRTPRPVQKIGRNAHDHARRVGLPAAGDYQVGGKDALRHEAA
ncbi:MAG: hypothetical protein LBC85_02420 [Fibromonadaceae bacterium]|nr:hypothetical protein [Fibromonadaceae bacterium]